MASSNKIHSEISEARREHCVGGSALNFVDCMGLFCGNKDAEAAAGTKKSKDIEKWLESENKKENNTLKLLLLGIGESGKSTITKQMKIIHDDGYDIENKRERIPSIRRNILDAMITILRAMTDLNIPFENEANQEGAGYLRHIAGNSELVFDELFYDFVENLWADEGVISCYKRANEYHLIDSAKYFLDRISAIREDDYIPTDQDILRCRVMTTSIAKIDFKVKDRKSTVHFRLYDVGGQRGERRKWIQIFECVTCIIFLADCSSFNQKMREDDETNRLVESIQIFDQVWNNRFLRQVPLLLFLNKIDRLKEKIEQGHSIKPMITEYFENLEKRAEITHQWRDEPECNLTRVWRGLDYDSYTPSESERKKFILAFPGASTMSPRAKKRRKSSDHNSGPTQLSENLVKTAAFIGKTFSELTRQTSSHKGHECHIYYTCAINTNQIKIIMESCRSFIITKHLERFGIL